MGVREAGGRLVCERLMENWWEGFCGELWGALWEAVWWVTILALALAGDPFPVWSWKRTVKK